MGSNKLGKETRAIGRGSVKGSYLGMNGCPWVSSPGATCPPPWLGVGGRWPLAAVFPVHSRAPKRDGLWRAAKLETA